MNKQVEDFLAKNSKYNCDSNSRESILIRAGLCEEVKEYDPNLCEYNVVSYKPIEVTDEEFEAVKNCLIAKDNSKSNTLSVIISIGAYVVLILGFIAGCILGQESSGWSSDFNISLALIVWGISAVSGISMLWFAEVLKLLNSIKNSLQKQL